MKKLEISSVHLLINRLAYNNCMISKIEDKLGLQLINIFLHLVLTYRVFPQVELLQMGQISACEEVQAHFT